jgi:hypothetical protein
MLSLVPKLHIYLSHALTLSKRPIITLAERLSCNLMGWIFKRFKTKFRYALKPVFVMLVDKQKTLDKKEWILLVNKMRQSIAVNPAEFLGDDLPEQDLLRDVLGEIFQEFMKERAYHETASGQQVYREIFNRSR